MKLYELLPQFAKCQPNDTVVIDVDADQCDSDRNVLDVLEARRENMGDETTGDDFWVFIQAAGDGAIPPTEDVETVTRERQSFIYLGRDKKAKQLMLAINADGINAGALKDRFKRAQLDAGAPSAGVFLTHLLNLFDQTK